MLKHSSSFKSPGRLLHLLLTVFGAALFLSLALESLEYLFPSRAVWSDFVRGQFQGLSHLLLLHLIVLPGLPALIWIRRSAPGVRNESIWTAAALGAWLLAAMFLVLALITGNLEANWMVALDQPETASLVTPPQLLTILFSCLSAELFLLLILAPMGGLPRNKSPERVFRLVGARLAALAVPLIGACAFLALAGRLTGLAAAQSASTGWIFTFVNAWTWTPLQTGLLLLALDRVYAELLPDSHTSGLPPVPHLHRVVVGLGFLSVFAFDFARFPNELPTLLHLGFMGLQGAVAVQWFSLGFLLLPRVLPTRSSLDRPGWLALGGLLWIGALVPLNLWIHLRADFGGGPANPWVTARDATLWMALGAAMLMMMDRSPGSAAAPKGSIRATQAALLFAALFWLTLLRLAATHYPVRIAIYPSGELHLHAALFLTAACAAALGLLGGLRRQKI